MTTSDWKKAFQQLKAKPVKMKKYIKHNSPKTRTTGVATAKCDRCGRYGGHIKRFGMSICRCCFREVAVKIGFRKYC